MYNPLRPPNKEQAAKLAEEHQLVAPSLGHEVIQAIGGVRYAVRFAAAALLNTPLQVTRGGLNLMANAFRAPADFVFDPVAKLADRASKQIHDVVAGPEAATAA